MPKRVLADIELEDELQLIEVAQELNRFADNSVKSVRMFVVPEDKDDMEPEELTKSDLEDLRSP